MKLLYFVTSNLEKLREMNQILAVDLEWSNIDLDEVQEIRAEEVARKKAITAYQLLHTPVLVEDTGLYFEAWKGLPGALIKWFLETVGSEGLCRMMAHEENQRALAQTVLGFYDGKLFLSFIGEVQGTIADTPRGTNGFGWDTIFIPDSYEKTYAEMTDEEKNKISMRRKALEKLKQFLISSPFAGSRR